MSVSASRTFRIFVSSTFSDLIEERNALARTVFPRLRELALSRGCRFEAIDLRWGVRDEAALDQQTMNICLSELRRCQRVSPRPNFLVILGDRYGWTPAPSQVEAAEFEQILETLKADQRRFLLRWYRRDDNAVPPEYLLRPRDASNPYERDPDRWSGTEEELRRALLAGVAALGWPAEDERRLKYEASATHREIVEALKGADAQSHVFCFFRRGGAGPASLVRLKQKLREKLRGNCLEFASLEDLCGNVYPRLAQIMEEEVAKMRGMGALEREIESHRCTGEELRRLFVGREDAMEQIADYLSGPDHRPLLVWGESGCGKSALMAKSVERTRAAGAAVLIERYIGSTPESSETRRLIENLCRQIADSYGAETKALPSELARLAEAFKEHLGLAEPGKPLVLFLDALDQLREGASTWLPGELPAHVRMVVSTIRPGRELDPLPATEVARLKAAETPRLLDTWLEDARRTLTPAQRSRILHAEASGLPLYLRLVFERARRWNSFAPEEEIRIPDGTAAAIEDLFEHLAKDSNHGRLMTDRTLGYLAASRYGLTEDELLDVLSRDREVLRDFRERSHHAPPGRRLPAVVWARLRADLEPYLTERISHGAPLLNLYHRQLAEAAGRRRSPARHRLLAFHFRRQPSWRGKLPNVRKAEEIPFQQREAGHRKALRRTLLDYEFLDLKCRSGLIHDLVADYPPGDEELQPLRRALESSAHILVRDPDQLASQLWGALCGARERWITGLLEDTIRLRSGAWLRPAARVLTTPEGYIRTRLFGHQSSVMAVAVTPDGRIISGSEDRTLKIWDPDAGREIKSLEGHTDVIYSVAVTADGQRAVSASADETLKIWDLNVGRELRTLAGHRGPVRAVAMTPDDRCAVSASEDGTLKIWDLETARELRTLAGHRGHVYDVAITPDGHRALSASEDGTLKLWDLETGRVLITLAGHTSRVVCAAITRDGRKALSASNDLTLRFWDLETGRVLQTMTGHRYEPWGVALSPDGSRAVSTALDETLRVWNIVTGEALQTIDAHSGQLFGVALMPDGRSAVVATEDCTVVLCDLHLGEAFPKSHGHTARVCGAVCARDGLAVTASKDGTLKIWDGGTGEEIKTLAGHGAPVRGVAASPDGRVVVSASEDRTVKVWGIPSGEEYLTFEDHESPVYCVALTKYDRAMSAGSCLMVWDIESEYVLHSMLGHTDAVLDIAAAPSGRHAVTASRDGTLKIWDLVTGDELATLAGHAHEVRGVAVTPDERFVVSCSLDSTIKVWEFPTGREIRTLKGHTSGIRRVAVAPNSRWLVSASKDQTLRVWDIETGTNVASFVCEVRPSCCAFTGDTSIVAGDESGRVYFLRLENLTNSP